MLFFSKAARDFNRFSATNSPAATTPMGLIGGITYVTAIIPAFIGAVVVAGALTATPLSILAIPAAILTFAGIAGGSAIGAAWAFAKSGFKPEGKNVEFDGLMMTGSRRDLGMVTSSTLAIRNITKQFQKFAQLPPKAQEKVDGFVADMTAAAARVNMYRKLDNGTYGPVSEFSITRTLETDGGQKTLPVTTLKVVPSSI